MPGRRGDPTGRIDERLLMARAREEPGKGVVVLRADRVELVVVAASTGHRQAQKRLGKDVDLVVDPPQLVLADVHRRVCALAQ